MMVMVVLVVFDLRFTCIFTFACLFWWLSFAVVALVSGHHICIFARDADSCGGVSGGGDGSGGSELSCLIWCNTTTNKNTSKQQEPQR